MTLTDIASIGGLISSLAVLVSLIFLGIQARHSDRAQLAAIRQQRTDRVIAINLSLLDAATALPILKGGQGDPDMSEAEHAQHSWYCRALFLNGEDAFGEYQKGLLDEAGFDSFTRQMGVFLAGVGVRVRWKRTRRFYGAAYAAFIDKLIAETPIVDYQTVAVSTSNWKAEVAAERAAADGARKPTA